MKPGETLNPKGRPSAGAAVVEWLNVMQEWKRSEVENVIADPKTPINKLIAARRWIEAIDKGDDFDRVCDRTEGKPKQTHDLHLTNDIEPADGAAELNQIVARLRERVGVN
jgi:hypothetical protein